MKNKKGLSTIISALLMVLLTIVAVAIVWVVVNKIIKERTDTSCFGNYEELTLNNDYTCYTIYPNDPDKKGDLKFSVSVKDIELDGIVVTIVGESGEKSYNIPDSDGDPNMKMYNGNYHEKIEIPAKNAGLSYVAKDIKEVDSVTINIAPIIKGEQCSVYDSITQIDSCAFIA